MIQTQARTRRFKLHHLPKAVIPSFLVLVRQRNNAARPLHLQPKPLCEFSFSVILIFLSYFFLISGSFSPVPALIVKQLKLSGTVHSSAAVKNPRPLASLLTLAMNSVSLFFIMVSEYSFIRLNISKFLSASRPYRVGITQSRFFITTHL